MTTTMPEPSTKELPESRTSTLQETLRAAVTAKHPAHEAGWFVLGGTNGRGNGPNQRLSDTQLISWTPMASVLDPEPVPGPTVPSVMNFTNRPTRQLVVPLVA